MFVRRVAAISAAGALLVVGCASITAEPSDSPNLPSSAAPSGLSTLVPTVAPTIQPTLTIATPPPSAVVETPRPSKSPKPPRSAAPSGPALPNLVVTKFVTDADPVVAGIDTSGRVTIKNIGTADAGSFSIGVSWQSDDGLNQGTYSGLPVDGLAAGDSVQVTVNITLPDPAAVTFTARADTDQTITESNEDDNTGTLAVTAVASMANLLFDSFTVAPDPANANGYTFDWVVRNSGTEDVTALIYVNTNYVSGTVSGMFEDSSCCTHPQPMLAAGDTLDLTTGPYYFPESGEFILTSTVDPDDYVPESDETDNYVTASVNVP
jgi:hypothetical protein